MQVVPHPTRVVAGAIALFAVAACSDQPLAPTRLGPTAPTRSASPNDRPSFIHDNSVKYQDAGSHPTTGHAGSASIMSRALLAKDGSTLVESTTGALDAGSPPGSISKVQAKLVHGTSESTNNYNGLSAGGYWAQTYTALGHHDLVDLHTNVRGIDGNRTDVVFTEDTIKLRPDLKASDLAAPQRAYVNTIVNIEATITEINHEVGARASCVLSVDGSPVDHAEAIWVDAGDAVTCAFLHVFPTVGTKAITVSATDVVPGDWDTGNNSAGGSIEIVTPEIRLSWSMVFSGWSGNQTARFDDVYGGREYYNYTTQDRSLRVSGNVRDATHFGPGMTFTAVLTSDATTIGTARAGVSSSSPSYGYDCRFGRDGATNTNFSACHYPWGQTVVVASNYSTHTVYYGYNYQWWGGYSYSEDFTRGFGPYVVGSTIGFDVTATDGNGTAWRAQASTPISALAVNYSYTYLGSYYSSASSANGTEYRGSNRGN